MDIGTKRDGKEVSELAWKQERERERAQEKT